MKHKYLFKNIIRQMVPVVLITTLLFGTSWIGSASPNPKETSVNSETQQTVVVTGKVTSSVDKGVLPGVSILIKGTTKATVSNSEGEYRIEVPGNNTVLSFSFIGFKTEEVAVNGQKVINVSLIETTKEFDEVVVTALGISRKEKSLGFAIGKVSGDDMSRVVQENAINALSGKVAGVQINSTGGTGSSVSMVIRGATSLSNDNQPLFVV
ncbi:MAG: carboxypeptidase-like regulatory domain-containing protein, partial [Bacteroidia bacterium]